VRQINICFRLFILHLISIAVASAQFSQPPVQAPVIPLPGRMIIQPGAFAIDEQTVIVVDTGASALLPVAKRLAEMIRRVSSFEPQVDIMPSVEAPPRSIRLGLTGSDVERTPEMYMLRVFPGGMRIDAGGTEGALHALQTLRQLLPPRFESDAGRDTTTSWLVPNCVIQDRPRFGWRALLLDCSVDFLGVNNVKRMIDVMAMLKFNRLHWRLTGNQSWRIEIRRYPGLTPSSRGRNSGALHEPDRYYSQEEIRSVVNYADSLGIVVIPEIRMPGHALAALASYPQYSCTGGPFRITSDSYTHKEIFCAGKNETFDFLIDILDEVIELFPSPWIHIGGDELPTYRWSRCEDCRMRIRDEGLHAADALQSYFIGRIERHLSELGRRTIITWRSEMYPESRNSVKQFWHTGQELATALRTGHDAIISPKDVAVFDYGNVVMDLRSVHNFQPLPEETLPSDAHRILGGVCMYATGHETQGRPDPLLFPRMFAMTEALWSRMELLDYNQFHSRVRQWYERLDTLGIQYGYESVPVRFDVRPGEEKHTLNVSLYAGQSGMRLYHSSIEHAEYLVPYEEALQLQNEGMLSAVAIGPGQRISDTIRLVYHAHSALAVGVELHQTPLSDHGVAAAATLVDGVRGSTSHLDGRWIGFEGHEIEAILDLGYTTPIHELRVGSLSISEARIFPPLSVTFSISQDGVVFEELHATVANTTSEDAVGRIVEFQSNVDGRSGRFVKMAAVCATVCPDEHPSAGMPVRVFLDEIIVE